MFPVTTHSGKTGRNRDGENKGREQGNTELPNLAVLGKLEAFTLPLVVLGRETIEGLKVALSKFDGSAMARRWAIRVENRELALDLIDDHQPSPNKRPGTRSNVETPMLNSEVFMILVSQHINYLEMSFSTSRLSEQFVPLN